MSPLPLVPLAPTAWKDVKALRSAVTCADTVRWDTSPRVVKEYVWNLDPQLTSVLAGPWP